jgi:hypothetical protein
VTRLTFSGGAGGRLAETVRPESLSGEITTTVGAFRKSWGRHAQPRTSDSWPRGRHARPSRTRAHPPKSLTRPEELGLIDQELALTGSESPPRFLTPMLLAVLLRPPKVLSTPCGHVVSCSKHMRKLNSSYPHYPSTFPSYPEEKWALARLSETLRLCVPSPLTLCGHIPRNHVARGSRPTRVRTPVSHVGAWYLGRGRTRRRKSCRDSPSAAGRHLRISRTNSDRCSL